MCIKIYIKIYWWMLHHSKSIPYTLLERLENQKVLFQRLQCCRGFGGTHRFAIYGGNNTNSWQYHDSISLSLKQSFGCRYSNRRFTCRISNKNKCWEQWVTEFGIILVLVSLVVAIRVSSPFLFGTRSIISVESYFQQFQYFTGTYFLHHHHYYYFKFL